MIGILIPTRNRPIQIIRILESLSANYLENLEVVVVSSGERIDDCIEPFKLRMNLTYIHTDQAGQIHQKKIGLTKFTKLVKWVIFLDDDLLVPSNFISQFNKQTSELPENIIGIGMNLGFTGKQITSKAFGKILSKFFLLSGEYGEIKRSGHACSYMLAKSIIKTQWLSGASAWRFDFASLYDSIHPFSKYAAYEDVIYSFGMSKLGDLRFIPDLKVEFQQEYPDDVPPLMAFVSAQYWRYYLVKSDKYFSVVQFFWSQIGRSLFYLISTKGLYFGIVLKVNWKILKCEILRGNPSELLIKNC